MNGYIEYPDGNYHEFPDVLELEYHDGVVAFLGSGRRAAAMVSLRDQAVIVYLADAPVTKHHPSGEPIG